MDEFERGRRRREAWERLRAQRRRAGQLRGRVVAISLICFALLWGVVFVQMETGNDPVLGDGSATAAVKRPAGSRGASQAKAPPVETEAAEAEPAETEVVEAEPEVVEEELEPLTTSQS